MAKQKRVSGMTVGPLLSEEQHDAILETRKRRKKVAQQGAAKRSGGTSKQSQDDTSEQGEQSEHVHFPES